MTRALHLLMYAGAALALNASTLRSAETHTIDKVHSTVLFKVKHLGAGNSYGRFNDLSGTIVIDDKDPSKSSVEVTVKVDSIDTASKGRDDHLKGPDFFSAKQFPTMAFKSTSVKVLPDGGLDVTGQLTIRGVAREVTAKVEKTGTGKAMRGDGKLTGFEAKLKIKRSDFDMKNMIPNIGDEVEILIAVECATT